MQHKKKINAFIKFIDIIFYTGSVLFIITGILISWKLAEYMTRDIRKLNDIVLDFVRSGLKNAHQQSFMPKITEIDTLNRSFMLLKKKITLMLHEKTEQRKLLVKSVLEGQERERKHIGEELHDNINQMLTAAKLYLEIAKERPDMIYRASTIIENTIQEVRTLSHNLVGPKAKELLLEESLKNLLGNLKVTAGYTIDFAWSDVDEKEFTENKKIALYRIVQEQINNVVKYSKAQNIAVSITKLENKLHLSVKDDGIGFDPAKKTNGIGFRNIHSRLETINGKMFLNTYPGKGCELLVCIPINSLHAD